MFFDSWASVGRTLVVGTMAYVALVVFLRLSGKRTLAKMNAFDLVVTVALGSTLATIITSRQTPLADGLAALLILIALQWLVAWVSVRQPLVEQLVKSEPTVLVLRGQIDHAASKRQRVAEAEIMAAARQAGIGRLSDVGVLVLETDGTFSAVRQEALGPAAGARSATTVVPEP